MRNQSYEDYDEEVVERGRGLRIFTLILLLFQGALSIGITGYLVYANLLPMMYLGAVGGVLAFVWLIQYFLLYKSKTVVIAKRIFSVFLSILFITGMGMVFWYLGGFMSTFNAISSLKKEEDIYTVRVLKTSGISDLSGVKGKTIGYSSLLEDSVLASAKTELNSKIGSSPKFSDYTDYDSLGSALLSGEAKVILFDEAMLSTVEENLEGFTDKTQVIYEIKIEKEVSKSQTKRDNIDVTKDSFNIYISGMDKAGKISSRGNSDVNILMTVNPKEKKILLTTTPRDFYVPLRGDSNKMDKLTHAGNYGVECSMETLSALYDTPIDFYVKVNFSSVEGLVNALGGVVVDCDKGFTATTRSGEKVSFKTGKNKLNGAQALAYSRERKSLAGGDRARGKHQQQIISALIDKLTSSSMLSNYNKVMKVISDNTVTDFGSKEMSALVKKELSNPSGWKTESISVDGTGDSKYTYSYKKKKVYVMIPNDATVKEAKAKIAQYMK